MAPDIMDKVEEVFFDYANKYDQNIKTLFQQYDIEISDQKLEEILDQAKKMVDNNN